MALMVCVWLPIWAVQRLRHERPELRSRPVVLSVDYRYFVTRTGIDEVQSANYLLQGS